MKTKVSFTSATGDTALPQIDLIGPGDDAVLLPIMLRFGARVVVSEMWSSDEGFHHRLHVSSLDGSSLGKHKLVRIAVEIARALSGQQPVKRALPRKGVAAA